MGKKDKYRLWILEHSGLGYNVLAPFDCGHPALSRIASVRVSRAITQPNKLLYTIERGMNRDGKEKPPLARKVEREGSHP